MAGGISGIQPGAAPLQPVSDFLAKTPAAMDGTSIQRLYVGRNNELKLSSNWFSHVFRMLTGKTQGAAALAASIKTELGASIGIGEEHLGARIGELRDFDRVVAERFDRPATEEFGPDDELQARIWNAFKNTQAENNGPEVAGGSVSDASVKSD